MTYGFTQKLSHFGTTATVMGLLAAFQLGSSEAATFLPIAISRQKATTQPKNLRYGSFGEPSINDAGEVAFYTVVYGSSVNFQTNQAIFIRFGNGNKRVRLIARSGTYAKVANNPGSSNPRQLLTSLDDQPLVTAPGDVMWQGVITEGTDINSLVSIGAKSGQSFCLFKYLNVQPDALDLVDVNSREALSLSALDTTRPDSPQTIFRSSFSHPNGRLVAAGDTVIGLPLGSTYASFGYPTLDDRYNVYFYTLINGQGTAYDGLWYVNSQSVQPIANKIATVSTVAPRTGGALFKTFVGSPAPSPRGQYCAFSATVDLADGTTVGGIWVTNTATTKITKVVKDGNRATDQPKALLSGFQGPCVNDKGSVAFLANATVSGGTPTLGLYRASISTGEITRLISVGDPFKVYGNTLSIIDIRFSSLGGLNRSNQMVCTLSFNNGSSGVYIVKP